MKYGIIIEIMKIQYVTLLLLPGNRYTQYIGILRDSSRDLNRITMYSSNM